MVSRFWTCDHVLPGLKSDEFQRCSELGVSSQVESTKELREISTEIIGSLINGKSRTKPGSNLKYRRLRRSSSSQTDVRALSDRGHTSGESKSQW